MHLSQSPTLILKLFSFSLIFHKISVNKYSYTLYIIHSIVQLRCGQPPPQLPWQPSLPRGHPMLQA